MSTMAAVPLLLPVTLLVYFVIMSESQIELRAKGSICIIGGGGISVDPKGLSKGMGVMSSGKSASIPGTFNSVGETILSGLSANCKKENLLNFN